MDDEFKFSWTVMFLVSGVSSFIFNFITKILEGNHSQLLLIIGTAASISGICCWIGNSVLEHTGRKKRKKKVIS